MLEHIGPVTNNNCVINRQNLFEQPSAGWNKLPSNVTRNVASSILLWLRCYFCIQHGNNSKFHDISCSLINNLLGISK